MKTRAYTGGRTWVECQSSPVWEGARNTHHATRITLEAPRPAPRALAITFHSSRFTPRILRITSSAFTLIEMLVVIAIMGMLAAIAVPTFNSFKPNALAASTQKLLTDVGRARQLAISHHTTVCMVFVPTNFWADPGYGPVASDQGERDKAERLWDKQLVAYNFVSLRSIGDQPGRPTVRYLDSWKVLPEGAFIPLAKFFPNNLSYDIITNGSTLPAFRVFGFRTTNLIPFPSETAPPVVSGSSKTWTTLPYIAFNYLGQLVDVEGRPTGVNELIPLAKGNVLFSRHPDTKVPRQALPTISESPPGNGTNSYTLVNLDWLTGRPHVERLEVR